MTDSLCPPHGLAGPGRGCLGGVQAWDPAPSHRALAVPVSGVAGLRAVTGGSVCEWRGPAWPVCGLSQDSVWVLQCFCTCHRLGPGCWPVGWPLSPVLPGTTQVPSEGPEALDAKVSGWLAAGTRAPLGPVQSAVTVCPVAGFLKPAL